VPIAVGFIAPAAYLVDAARERVQFAGVSAANVSETTATLGLSAIATVLTLGVGVAVVYAVRVNRGRVAAMFFTIASLGYAIPGTVVALGLLPVVTGIEAAVDATLGRALGISVGLFMLGSGAAIVYAYMVRFLALAAGSAEAGLSRVPTSLDEAARTLGEGSAGRLWRIHLPLTRPALAAGALLVFVDCMKELPATLLLRPLGVETLATHLYGEAVRGTYEEAAIAALLIVVAGLLPVILLARVSRAGNSADTAIGM